MKYQRRVTQADRDQLVGQTVKVLLRDGSTVEGKVYGRLLDFPVIDWGTGHAQWTWQSVQNGVVHGCTLRE